MTLNESQRDAEIEALLVRLQNVAAERDLAIAEATRCRCQRNALVALIDEIGIATTDLIGSCAVSGVMCESDVVGLTSARFHDHVNRLSAIRSRARQALGPVSTLPAP